MNYKYFIILFRYMRADAVKLFFKLINLYIYYIILWHKNLIKFPYYSKKRLLKKGQEERSNSILSTMSYFFRPSFFPCLLWSSFLFPHPKAKSCCLASSSSMQSSNVSIFSLTKFAIKEPTYNSIHYSSLFIFDQTIQYCLLTKLREW